MNKAEEKVSVIVPVYNTGKNLDVCLNSLLNQNYTNYEIIIVDDGSSKITKDKLKSYSKYSKIQIYSITHSGPSKSRNVGISKATGKYIMFCDSDDKVDKNWIYKLASQCKPFSMCAYSKALKNNDKEIIRFYRSKIIPWKETKKIFFGEKDIDIFSVIWNKCFYTSIIKHNNIKFDENICHWEDTIFVINYFSCLNKKAKIIYIDEVLYQYNFSSQGLHVQDNYLTRTKILNYLSKIKNKNNSFTNKMINKLAKTIQYFLVKELFFNNKNNLISQLNLYKKTNLYIFFKRKTSPNKRKIFKNRARFKINNIKHAHGIIIIIIILF